MRNHIPNRSAIKGSGVRWRRPACLALVGVLSGSGPVVSQSSPPAWRLVQEWSRGGEADGPLDFDQISGLLPLPGGRVAVLSARAPNLRMLDSSGAVVRAIGRSGAGPAEFRFPAGIAVAPNGTIVVNDPGNGRLTVFSPAGEYVRDVRMVRRPINGFNILWEASFDRTGRLLQSVGIRARRADPTMPPGADSAIVTERWTADFAAADSVAACGAPPPVYRDPLRYERRIPPPSGGVSGSGGAPRPPGGAIVWPQFPFTEHGALFARDLDGFEWAPREDGSPELVRRESGQCGRIIARLTLRGPRAPIPAAARDSALQEVPREHHRAVPATYPWLRSLHIDDQNRLWVERDAPGRRWFEIFAPNGVAVAIVQAPARLDRDEGGIASHYAMGNGRLYGFVKDADDVARLVSWRIVMR